MKIDRLTGLILTTAAAFWLERAAAQPLDLSLYTSAGGAGFYTNTFDELGYGPNQTLDGTPGGPPGSLAGEWTCYLNATANYFGTIASGAPNGAGPGLIDTWTDPFVGEFKNFASYFDYIGGTNFYPSGVLTNLSYGVITNGLYQTNEPNRCLGIRQTGSFGDPGASFTLKLLNTAPYENFKMSVDVMNLDPSSPRETIWHIQYGVADPTIGVPAAFQDIPGLSSVFVNVPGSLHYKTIHISIPNGTINNIDAQVWIRVVTLATSTTSGNRETFAIDNFGLSWTNGEAGCTPATNAITITPPTAPVYANATVQFTVNEAATQPIYYQWLYEGQDVSQVFPSQVVGYSYRSSILTLQNVTTANNGSYSCIISNVCGGVYAQTSAPVVLAVTNVPVVSLGYLRTLTDSSNSYAVTTPQSQLWQVTGMITTVTNTTSGNTASYYIQDASGGMNLFVTGGASFRPEIGDVVTAVGYLNSFQGNLELEADLTGQNDATSVQDLSNNIAAYPDAMLLDWPTEFAVGVTNNTVEQGTTNSMGALTGLGSKKGSVCLLTNVYFGTNAGITINGNYYVSVTNASGLNGYLFFWGAFNPDLQGRVLPSFATSVKGVLFANVVSGGGSFWSGLGVSSWSDVLPRDLISIAYSPTNGATLSCTNVPISILGAPYTPYSIWASTDLTSTSWTTIATGLTNVPLYYTDPDTNSAQKFYRLSSP
jgi:hypothetical protein